MPHNITSSGVGALAFLFVVPTASLAPDVEWTKIPGPLGPETEQAHLMAGSEQTLADDGVPALPELTGSEVEQRWETVRGERFLWDWDPDLGLVLMHPIWSLMGHGATEADAIAELERDARDIAEELNNPDFPFALDAETERLRDYAIQFLE